MEVGQYYRLTVLGKKTRSRVIEKLANFSRLTKVGQQKIFSNVFENTMTYRWKSQNVIGWCLLYEISRPWNDVVMIKFIEVYEVNWFLYDSDDPNYHNWYLSVNDDAQSEFILFGTRHNLAKLSDECHSLTVRRLFPVLMFTRSWHSVGQRDVHAATHQQDYQHASITFGGCVISKIMPVSHGTACDVTCRHSHWLLQLCLHWPSCMYTSTTAMSTKHGHSIDNNNNNRISIASYGRNFRGAGGRSDQCSVKAWLKPDWSVVELVASVNYIELHDDAVVHRWSSYLISRSSRYRFRG